MKLQTFPCIACGRKLTVSGGFVLCARCRKLDPIQREAKIALQGAKRTAQLLSGAFKKVF